MMVLSDPLSRLECFGADVTELAVDSDSLVPHLDPFKDSCTRLVVRAEMLVMDEFLLQGRLEAFDHGVVIAVAGLAHALRHAIRFVNIPTSSSRIKAYFTTDSKEISPLKISNSRVSTAEPFGKPTLY